MNFKKLGVTAAVILSWAGLSGCSSAYKQRQIEKDRVAQSSGLFCEFINGDDHNDIDVELNVQMAKKCDLSKHYEMTNYKNASDIFGVVYCCATKAKPTMAAPVKSSVPAKDNKDKKSGEHDEAVTE